MPRHNLALIHPGVWKDPKKRKDRNAHPRGAIHPRKRVTRKPPPKLTMEQRKAQHETAEDTRNKIKEAVAEWIKEIEAKAEALGEIFSRKPRYFLDLLYYNGVKLTKPQAKTNPWNAWKHFKAIELKEGGDNPMSMEEMVETYRHEYDALGEEEKEDLVQMFDESKSDEEEDTISMSTARSHAQKIVSLISTTIDILEAGKRRCGIEAMVLFVRNHTEATLYPKWYFTHPAMNGYMRHAVRNGWDSDVVGTMMEAFAIVGCDPIKLLRMSDARTKWYKAEIRDLARQKLSNAIGQPVKSFPYDHFDKQITLPHGVVVENWPLSTFENPSKMGSAHAPLIKLYEALDKDVVKFWKMEADEWQAWIDKYHADLADGTRLEPPHNPRKDIGKTRGPQKKSFVNFDNSDGEELQRASKGKGKWRKESSDESSSDEEVPPPRKKKTASSAQAQGNRYRVNNSTSEDNLPNPSPLPPPSSCRQRASGTTPSHDNDNKDLDPLTQPIPTQPTTSSCPRPQIISRGKRCPATEEESGDMSGANPSGPTCTTSSDRPARQHSPPTDPLFLPEPGNSDPAPEDSDSDSDGGNQDPGNDGSHMATGNVPEEDLGAGKRVRKKKVMESLFTEDHPNTKEPSTRKKSGGVVTSRKNVKLTSAKPGETVKKATVKKAARLSQNRH
ncbi:hypothetical protein Moror_11898 [Moniliophthora roreri MCA 2997]|uniref:Uncharacterized protein n=2 Tax=Moniliophthora roreri TaxID=221103 RepID=V2X3T4_MONRO|nr:hypothetical protein Moror_11898 [Moniliophthora roreri MCA 2997]